MSSTTLFSRTAANTIPYPAPQVHKFPRPIHIPRFSLDPAPIALEDGYEQIFRNGLGQEVSRQLEIWKALTAQPTSTHDPRE